MTTRPDHPGDAARAMAEAEAASLRERVKELEQPLTGGVAEVMQYVDDRDFSDAEMVRWLNGLVAQARAEERDLLVQAAKEDLLTAILQERERCAEIAETHCKHDCAGQPLDSEEHKRWCETYRAATAIAAAIRQGSK